MNKKTRKRKIKHFNKKAFDTEKREDVDLASILDIEREIGLSKKDKGMHKIYCLKEGDCSFDQLLNNFDILTTSWIFFKNARDMKYYYNKVIEGNKTKSRRELIKRNGFTTCDVSPKKEKCQELLKAWIRCKSGDVILLFDYSNGEDTVISIDGTEFVYVEMSKKPEIIDINC